MVDSLILQHYEVRIERVDDQEICEYSYLGEQFPDPEFPSSVKYNVNVWGLILLQKEKAIGDNHFGFYNYQHHRQYIDITITSEESSIFS